MLRQPRRGTQLLGRSDRRGPSAKCARSRRRCPPPASSTSEPELLLPASDDPGHDAAPLNELLGSSQDRHADGWVPPDK